MFLSDVGPDASGSMPGNDGCHQMPAKSGTAPLCAPSDATTLCPARTAAETTLASKTGVDQRMLSLHSHEIGLLADILAQTGESWTAEAAPLPRHPAAVVRSW